jgi:YbbR domain-containing protein
MWRTIFQNLWFKLVAVAMALLLWFHVATDNVYEYGDKFPLELAKIPETLLLAEKLPEYVNVTIQGKGKELIKLMVTEKESLKIDAGEFKRGETDYSIKPEDVPLPEGLELRVANILPPKNLKINLDYPMEKKVQVQPRITVLPEDGFIKVGDPHYNPKEVTISGPRTWVRNISEVVTRERIIENAKEPISEQIDLVKPEGYNLVLSQQKINYSLNVERTAERRLSDLPVKIMNPPRRGKVELQPDNISLTLSGAQSLIDKVDIDSIRVTINCAKLSRGDTTRLPLSVNLPPGTKLVKAEPDSVNTIIK